MRGYIRGCFANSGLISLESFDLAEQAGHVFDGEVATVSSTTVGNQLNHLDAQDLELGSDLGAESVRGLLDDQAHLGALADVLENTTVQGIAVGIDEDRLGALGLATLAVFDQTFIIPFGEGDFTTLGVGSL